MDFNTLNIYGNVQRIKRIYTLFTTLILVGFIAGILILISNDNWLQVIVVGATIPLVLLSYYFIRKTRFELASVFLAVILFTLITIISTSGQGIHAITNLGFPAILIIASLVIRKRTLIFLVFYAILCVAWLVFGELLGLYQPGPWARSVPGDFFTVLVIIVATTVMVRSLTEALFRSHQDVQRELAERKRAEEKLAYDALHDALTGLPNRSLFLDRLTQRMDHARRHPQERFGILYIDLDRIKVINDSLGHAVGDQLLIETSRRLTRCMRPTDTVARLGGDEFAILVDECLEASDVVHAAEKVQSELSATIMIEGLNRLTSASIGITVYDVRYTDAKEMLRDADAAMYRAKARGGGHYAVFDETMHASAMALLQIEADLRHAVEHKEWLVYYQPIVTLPERKLVGVEALVRWQHPQRGMVNPDEFIHAAEDSGLILPMGEYVLREACRQVYAWRGKKHPGLFVSVNLSGRQFQSDLLIELVSQTLDETGMSGDGLQLEITESIAMQDLSHTARVLGDLDQMGIRIALDDFGNGYSSLSYLNRFPIRILKVDRTFIRDLVKMKSSGTITRAIVSMGHALDMQVVAEGVETEEQLQYLQSIDCDEIQGFLISPPVPVKELESLL